MKQQQEVLIYGDNTLGYTVNGGIALNQMQLVVDIVILPVKPQMQSMNLNFKSKGRVVQPTLTFLCEQKCLQSGFDYTGNANTAGGQRVGAGNDVGDRFKWIWDGRTGIGDQNIITSFNDLDENGTYEN